MHIVQQTSSRLILRSYPWFIWIFGVVFTAGGVIASSSIGSQTLTCNREVSVRETAEDSVSSGCHLEWATWWSKTTQHLALSDLQQAEVESSSDSDGHTSHRVVLRTKQESVPLTTYFISGRINYSKQQASLINAFLQNPQQPTLRLAQNHTGWALLFLGCFSGLGLATMVFIGHINTCELDKLSGRFTLKRRGIFNQTAIEHPLQHIKEMRILSQSDDESTTYQLNFVLTSGELVPFENYYSSGYRSKESTAQIICTFLGIKL